MAYAPQNDSSSTAGVSSAAASSNANRSNSSFTKELVGCRVIRNERDWKWSKQVSLICFFYLNFTHNDWRT